MYRGYRQKGNFGGRDQRRFRPVGQSRRSATDIVRAIRALQFAPKSETPEEEYQPKNSFNDFQLSEKLKGNISFKKYTNPTPIQDQVIGPILQGSDIIGIANTGTGKTAAFLIPLVEKVTRGYRDRVLILTPTRELAVQINEELRGFTYGLKIYSALCVGGMNIGRQRNELRRGAHFVIGTPGRIKDFAERRDLDLSSFTVVVLDEADRMVDIGFIHDIKYFISMFSKTRQSLFFSATVPPKVNDILRSFVRNAVTVSVKKTDTTSNIAQSIVEVSGKEEKIEKLHKLLIQEEYEKVLVFGRTKWSMQKLSNELLKRGFNADVIHGNKSQNQRIKTLDKFKKNQVKILIATDVASRGLDIPDVSHVINYDLPDSLEDYIHRIGRTGRANKKGIALTFVE